MYPSSPNIRGARGRAVGGGSYSSVACLESFAHLPRILIGYGSTPHACRDMDSGDRQL